MCAKCQQLVPVRRSMVIVGSWTVRYAADLVQLCMQCLQRHAICLCRASTCDSRRMSFSSVWTLTVLGADCWYVGVQADGTAPENKVTFCQECGNNVHVECFKRWTASKKGSGEPVTCVYCRCPWVVESGIAAPKFGPDVCSLWHAIAPLHIHMVTSTKVCWGRGMFSHDPRWRSAIFCLHPA